MLATIPKDVEVHLNEIAERLWSGHASVMVGAGFSKNAIRNSANSKPFLNWNELADIFYEKLNGHKPKTDEHYLNSMKLAEEVCAAFGRPALEKLMQSALPNLDYSPSDLHKNLMELPWNDVFTTNYDTLLERTNVSQRYDVVLSKNDLVFSQRPRIIKLHGSFPSHRPFIITEEDYRKYPREYAPLVNTVQQSLIENTLCLIGFSGDDPNFLSWIGWIRDNLGSSSSPRIFLIGVLNLSSSQVKVLEQRNIGIIDLSPCVANEPEKHKAALRIFIEFLMSKKAEENRLDWPGNETTKMSPSRDTTDDAFTDEISSVIEHWRKTREDYPGWIICPRDSRKILWIHTSNWFHGRHLKAAMPFTLDIKFWRELAWRLEKSLSPLSDEMVLAIETATARYNVFPDIFNVQPEFIRSINSGDANWDNIAEAWIYLNLALLRFYREEGLPEKWTACSNALEQCLDKLSSAQKDNFRYEQCLFHLFRQEIVEFRNALQGWKPDDSSPFYQAKKSGLLAEHGDISDAKTLLESALQSVRSQLNLNPITTDYSNLSQESYMLQLLRFINDSTSSFLSEKNSDRKYIEEFSLRWTKLKQYKCDPWGELQLFEAKLSNPARERKDIEVVHGFDIGHSSTTHHLGNDGEALEAYAFLRHMDDIGIPYHIGNMTFGKDAGVGAVKRIAKTSLNWAIATLLRTGDSKSVDALFNRSSLVAETPEKIGALVDVLLKMLADLGEDIEKADRWSNRNMGAHYASIVPEILSRLCTICPLDKLKKILDFLLVVYKSPHFMKYSNIDHLAQRLVASWPPEELTNLISIVISEFPIIKVQHPGFRSDFPDLLEFIENELPPKVFDRIKVSTDCVDRIISDFENASDDHRFIFLSRISKLLKYKLLSDDQKVRFGTSLWRTTDDSGFPTGFESIFRWYFLKLPYPSNIDVDQKLRTFLQSLKFPVRGNAKSISISGGQCRPCSEIINACDMLHRVGWSSDDALNLLKKIKAWWESDKHFLIDGDKNNFSDRPKELRGRFQKAVRTLEVAAIPLLSDESFQDNNEDIKSLLTEMNTSGISVIELKVALFLKSPNNLETLLVDIEADILSDDLLLAVRAIVAVTILLDPKNKHAINEKDRDQLYSLIVGPIKWRKSKAIIPALANFKLLLQQPMTDWERYIPEILPGLQNIANESNLAYEDGPISPHDRLFVRQAAASLSHALFIFYSKKGLPISPVLEKWKSICHDPGEFAEIRNQWAE